MLNTYVHPKFGSFQADKACKVPKFSFNVYDKRCDPLVNVAVKAMEGALSNAAANELSLQTAVFSVTDTGCRSHVKRVIDALETMRPRQAFFARGSAVMFSTYSSMAIGSHGPCISISGRGTAIALALNLAKRFLNTRDCQMAILLCADQVDGALKASAACFSPTNIGEIDKLIAFSLDAANANVYAESIITSFFAEEGSK